MIKAYLALLKGPMGWLWTSRTLSDIGDSIHLLAFNWLLVQKTGSALAVATASIMWLGGQVIAGWPGGRLADRFAPVRVLQGAYLAHALVIGSFAIAALADQVPVTLCYGLAFILGILGTPVDPASRALLVELYPAREDLTQANGLFATGTAVGQTLGPVLGGIIFTWVPLGWAFGVNALSYTLATLGLIAVRVSGAKHRVVIEYSESDPPEPVTAPLSWQAQARLSLKLLDVLIPVTLFVCWIGPLLTALLPYYIASQSGKLIDLGLLQSALWTGVGLGLGLGGWLGSRVATPATWALGGLACAALGAGSFSLIQGVGAAALLGGVGLACGTSYVLLNQVLLDRIDRANISGLTGLLGSVLGLGIALFSFIWGTLVEQGYFGILLITGSAVVLGALGLGLVFKPKPKPLGGSGVPRQTK